MSDNNRGRLAGALVASIVGAFLLFYSGRQGSEEWLAFAAVVGGAARRDSAHPGLPDGGIGLLRRHDERELPPGRDGLDEPFLALELVLTIGWHTAGWWGIDRWIIPRLQPLWKRHPVRRCARGTPRGSVTGVTTSRRLGEWRTSGGSREAQDWIQENEYGVVMHPDGACAGVLLGRPYGDAAQAHGDVNPVGRE